MPGDRTRVRTPAPDRTVPTLLSSIALLGIGMGVYLLALGQLLYELTGSPQAFALALTLQGAAAVCVLPFSGPLVDALDSRRVHTACSLARAVTVAGLALAGLTRPPGAVALIAAGVVLLAFVDNVQRAALFKYTAWHVESARRARLNALINVAVQVGALTGMALLGMLLLWTSLAGALLADTAVALAVAVLVRGLPATAPEPRGPAAGVLRTALPLALHDWRAMFHRYRGDLAVLGVIVLCAADFVFQSCVSTLVVPLVAEHYGGRGQYVSLLEAVFALGMIASSFFTRHTQRAALLPLWCAVQAAAALALGLSAAPAVHLAALLAAGFANLSALTWLLTSLQSRAGDGEKAKMASLRMLSIGLATTALMPLIGHFAGVSLTAGFVATAAVMLAFTALATATTAPRHAPGKAEAQTPEPATR
ncbi:MFS transporter [Streptomyces sp. NBC_01006]|uniref:MFS transporter n=1 Tax=Streptomyces sp. NBC_01006 TaxID=2903716 RepID=UPI002F9077F2|nr:MFS transporter [Streptomyces sp. NBC_01006]